MATKKTLITKKMECISVNLQANRSQVNFADGVKREERSATARNVISMVCSNADDAAAFKPGKSYTIEISE